MCLSAHRHTQATCVVILVFVDRMYIFHFLTLWIPSSTSSDAVKQGVEQCFIFYSIIN